MAAPAAAAMPLVLAGGRAGGRTVMDAISGDLLVIRTQRMRGRGKRRKPVDVEFHVNPLGIGSLLVGAGLALWLAQLRLAPAVNNEGKPVVTLQSRVGFLGSGAGTSVAWNKGILGDVGIGHGLLFAPFDWLTGGR